MAFNRKRSGSQDSDLSHTPEEWDEKARGWLLGRLTRGPRSKAQLARMLAEKGVPEEVAQPLLDRFEDVGLIDDASYARAFARDRRQSRGLAKSALRRELGQAGVDQELVTEALEEYSAEDDLDLAISLVEKRWQGLARLERDARYRRISSYLGRRGFSGSTISTAIRTVEDAERLA
jgi:regulatory protein